MHLGDYPLLEEWHLSHPTYVSMNQSNMSLTEFNLIKGICKALSEETIKQYYTWFKTCKNFVEDLDTSDEFYQEVEQFFQNHNIDLQVYASEQGYNAFSLEDGRRFFSLSQKFADITHLVAYRFLAAWSALNLDERELCVEECEKVDQPYASIFTIQGQALLELGSLPDAIEALTVATKINPEETLAYFQLAKANFALGATNLAWKAAATCHKQNPEDGEIALLLVMIALEMKDDQAKCDAWNNLYQCLPRFDSSAIMIKHLLALSFQQKNKDWAESVVGSTNWKKVFEDKEFIRDIGGILKGFGENNWFDLSQIILSEFDNTLVSA
jgi:tetratricopeptide (TPR) repeat protein